MTAREIERQSLSRAPTLEQMPGDSGLARVGRRAGSVEERRAVDRARGGDETAFAILVDRYGQPVLSLCYASTLNPADAEDLAQDVFLAAWRGLPGFRGEASFSTWLFALARNACIDRARRVAVRPQLVVEHDELGTEPITDTTRVTSVAIFAAAATLPVPLRQALLLRDIQGLTYEEIAKLQDVPLGTVRSRIAAARSAVARAVRG
jgi:RNA polymerase sigma-70 factor (ECF subfamily)